MRNQSAFQQTRGICYFLKCDNNQGPRGRLGFSGIWTSLGLPRLLLRVNCDSEHLGIGYMRRLLRPPSRPVDAEPRQRKGIDGTCDLHTCNNSLLHRRNRVGQNNCWIFWPCVASTELHPIIFQLPSNQQCAVLLGAPKANLRDSLLVTP